MHKELVGLSISHYLKETTITGIFKSINACGFFYTFLNE